MKRFLGVLFALVLVFSLAAISLPSPAWALPNEVWVDDDFTPATPGWGTTHFDNIQDGIDAVASLGTVHVAGGTYAESIILKVGVQVLGAGSDMSTINGTTARGGLPAYHVVTGADNATLDGFTVTGGSANGTGNNGIGGGMYNWYSSPTVTNCTFLSNSAWDGGGGMVNWYSSPTVTNCTFSSNSVGGILNWEYLPTVTNCILWDNDYEISNGDNLTTVTYCDIQGGYSGEGNIDANPMFADPAGGDYHLQLGSPCIDAGTNVGAPTEDIEGNPRPIDGDGDGDADTDMGAYEYVGATVDFDPDTLNLRSKGKMVTVYIELPLGYDVNDIDVGTLFLNGAILAEPKPIEVGDYDGDGISDLMVKFDRAAVQGILLEPGDQVVVTVSGQLINGTPFGGTDTIRVIEKGKN